ncbi:hypothetical protein Anapl_11608 [Anas platyrhynchos]|uniref:Uncharacterized protein n=1 Tax=Anas platyrhynchos TaxID=8839 RepID=R0JYX6_ANAPL|nr:hypothetical protein Anapl_11608 [Anas platyrhynchos]
MLFFAKLSPAAVLKQAAHTQFDRSVLLPSSNHPLSSLHRGSMAGPDFLVFGPELMFSVSTGLWVVVVAAAVLLCKWQQHRNASELPLFAKQPRELQQLKAQKRTAFPKLEETDNSFGREVKRENGFLNKMRLLSQHEAFSQSISAGLQFTSHLWPQVAQQLSHRCLPSSKHQQNPHIMKGSQEFLLSVVEDKCMLQQQEDRESPTPELRALQVM